MKRVPFDYILVSIMSILNDRKLELRINKNSLRKIIDIILCNLSISNENRLSIVNNFDFDYELDRFYNDYIEYFMIENDYIYLEDNVDIGELFDMLDDNTDDLLLEEIDDLLEININIIELMGVKIRKDIYKWLYDSLEKDKELYNDNNIRKKQLHLFERRLFLFNLNSLGIDTMYDLLLYSDSKVDEINTDLKNKNNIFRRMLFREDNLNVCITNYKLNYELEKVVNINLVKYLDDYKFYLSFYYILCEEIDKLEMGKLRDELIKTRYSLMMLIDGIFDNNLFMNMDNNSLDEYIGRYEYNNMMIYNFIDEILSCDDSLYYKDNVLEYFNVIKKLFIKTYYSITNDNDIITSIKENKYYGINKISSGYLNDIVNNPKKRIKKDNYQKYLGIYIFMK